MNNNANLKHGFTNDERNLAHNTNLIEFLVKQGENIRRSGSNNYWMHDGETISIRGNLWFNHYSQKGGEAIDFVREFYGVSYPEAVAMLLGMSSAELIGREHVVGLVEPFALPESDDNTRRVYTYLTKPRGIDKNVVSEFIKHNLIYEDKAHHNVVFVGVDLNGHPRHAHMRGTGSESTFKMTIPRSDPAYSFHWYGNDNELYLFEAPIDMLSYISMNLCDWQNHTYAASCSVTDRVLFQCISDNPRINTIHICFDNDIAGQKVAKRIIEKLSGRDFIVDIVRPQFKDWNEDLTTPIGMMPMGKGMFINYEEEIHGD